MALSSELSRHSATILVVDAVEAIRYAHSQILSQASYRVIEASTGEEALLKATSHRPDVILLNVSLPSMDGLEVCRRLKADHELSHIMVLQVSSAHTSKIDLGAGVEVGADGYLIEPIDPAELLVTVKALLRLADREKENARLIQQLSRSERQFADATSAEDRGLAKDVVLAAHDTFRHLVEQSPFGVYAVDADFRLVQVSAGAQKVFENVRPLLGRDFSDVLRQIWPEPFASEAIRLFRHTLETGEPYHAPSTVERRRDSGELESYDWKIERIRLPDGRWGVVCHFYDLSEHQRYEAELRESEERFRHMADHAPVMVWVTKADGSCSFLSQSWYAFTGQSPETGLGFGWLNAVHPKDRPSSEATFKRATDTHSAFRLEYRLRRHDGEYRWAIDAATPRFSNDGNFLGYIGSVIDITDRQEAEIKLRESESRYRYMFESAGVSLFEEDWSDVRRWLDTLRAQGVTDLRHHLETHPETVADAIPLVRISDANTYSLRLFKAESKQDLLESLERIFVAETLPVFKEELIALWEGRSLYDWEAPLRTLKGDDLYVLFTLVRPEYDPDWQRVVVAVTDITALKKVQAELKHWKDELEVRVQERTQELEATQERLVALSSQLSVTEQQERRKLARDLHDYLAQILVVGQMRAKLALKQSVLPPATRNVVEDIEKMFQQALTYTRTLIAELSPPNLHEFGLPQALQWLGERFHKERLWVEVRANCEQVPLSEEQSVIMFQAVRELLFNVLKHAEVDRATVDLRLDEEGLLQIAVSDQGRGLSPDAMKRSSEPGHLGLFSVRERIEAMGGRVKLESSPGVGTTVTLMLPVGDNTPSAEAHVPSADTSRLHAHGYGLEHAPIRVLLADDHTLVRQGLRDILAADDRIRVVGEASTCEEALMLTANLAPDVVITDINLPAINGVEATKRLKNLHPQLAVIGLSGHAEEHMKQDMLSAGAETLLSKECATEELTAKIVNIYTQRSRR